MTKAERLKHMADQADGIKDQLVEYETAKAMMGYKARVTEMLKGARLSEIRVDIADNQYLLIEVPPECKPLLVGTLKTIAEYIERKSQSVVDAYEETADDANDLWIERVIRQVSTIKDVYVKTVTPPPIDLHTDFKGGWEVKVPTATPADARLQQAVLNKIDKPDECIVWCTAYNKECSATANKKCAKGYVSRTCPFTKQVPTMHFGSLGTK